MAWQTYTLSDVAACFTDGEWAGLSRDADTLAKAQTILTSAINQCRGAISVRHKLGPDGTLPSQAEAPLMQIMVLRMLTRFPKMGLITEARQKEADQGYKWLAAIQQTSEGIDIPETGPATETFIPAPAIGKWSGKPKQFTWRSQNGL